MNTIRVQVVAHSPAVQAGLRALLNVDGLELLDDAGSAEVIVCDDTALSIVHVGLGRPGVVLLSDAEVAVQSLAALEAPGWAVLPTDASGDELRAAVTAVAFGLVVLPAHTAPAWLRDDLEPPAPSPHEPIEALTAREHAVLELLALGLPNKRIARQLQISESTVKFHLVAIYAKLGVSGRVAAVNAAARRGLVTL